MDKKKQREENKKKQREEWEKEWDELIKKDKESLEILKKAEENLTPEEKEKFKRETIMIIAIIAFTFLILFAWDWYQNDYKNHPEKYTTWEHGIIYIYPLD